MDRHTLGDEVDDGLERSGLVSNDGDLVVLLLKSLLNLGDGGVGSDLGVLVESGLEVRDGSKLGIRGEELLGSGSHGANM